MSGELMTGRVHAAAQSLRATLGQGGKGWPRREEAEGQAREGSALQPQRWAAVGRRLLPRPPAPQDWGIC